jgi:hypothetical protein
MLSDRTLTCRDCAQEFVFTTREQAFLAARGSVGAPSRCPDCRALRRREASQRRSQLPVS